jgi:CubicO group peptidase (beta-lactamase class C family)
LRNQTLQGDVHDPTAAILGGVSGNAGLFSNAHDLGVLFQMLLNGGTYGGIRYLSPGVVSMFTTRQPGSHRGLGFDMQAYKAICAPDASRSTYGHTGFTGTCVWVDPDRDMVFVFLSNRVHPSAKNWRLNTLRVRQNIHQAVYDAFEPAAAPVSPPSGV